ncbi:MAG: transporter substrate-binding domain-containing protein [Cohaesibacteraceae bacterium]|nr:transporter substrate-binding domain-containing protein [Cohaesibacteraceae bacterium]
MNKLSKTIGAALLGLTLGVSNVAAEKIHIVVEDFAPFNYMEDGEFKGIAPAIVKELISRVDSEVSMEMLPWKRGYKMAHDNANTGIYSMLRTSVREDEFQWVGPLYSAREYIFMRTGEEIEVNSLNDLKKLGSIAAQAGGGLHQMLVKHGLTNIMEVHDVNRLATMLVRGRTDALAIADLGLAHELKKLGKENGTVTPVMFFGEARLYLGFSKKTSKTEIAKWTTAYAAMKADGTLDKIRAQYVPDAQDWHADQISEIDAYSF